MKRLLACFVVALMAQNQFTPGIKPFVRIDAPVVALRHVRVIDGTGAAPVEDQTLVLDHGRIAAMGSAVNAPAGAQVIDLTGATVIPGLVAWRQGHRASLLHRVSRSGGDGYR